MSEFDKFCKAAKRTAKKITTKAGEIVDTTAHKLKIKNLEVRIDEQYEILGELVYRTLRTGEDTEQKRMKATDTIDALFAEIDALKKAAEEVPHKNAPEAEATEVPEEAPADPVTSPDEKPTEEA